MIGSNARTRPAAGFTRIECVAAVVTVAARDRLLDDLYQDCLQ